MILSLPARIGRALLATGLALAVPAAAQAEGGRSIALVLDASGSMKARLADGASRMDAAKAAVAEVVGTLPAGTRLALRAYGFQSPTARKDCQDTALLVPFGDAAGNGRDIVGKAQGLQPLGYTPIAYSLTQAAGDLAREEVGSRVVVLVSDGKETCGGDPCVTAKALADADATLVVHTVGVDVDSVTRAQLQCIADNARGTYADAGSTAELAKAVGLAAVTAAAPPPAKTQRVQVVPKFGKLKMAMVGVFNAHPILNAKGQEAGSLTDAQPEIPLSPGLYSVTFDNGLWSGIEIRPGETTEIKPGYLRIDPLGGGFDRADILDPETGEVLKSLSWSANEVTLIPGRIDIRFGDTLWPGGVEVKPGEKTVVRPGVVRIKSSIDFDFLVRTPDGRQAREGSTIGGSSFAMPPGDYVLEIDPQHRLPGIGDDQRRIEIHLEEGQELAIEMG